MKMKKGFGKFGKRIASSFLAAALCMTAMPVSKLSFVSDAAAPAERADSSMVYFVDCGDYIVDTVSTTCWKWYESVDKTKKNYLTCQYLKTDNSKTMTIKVGDTVIATETLNYTGDKDIYAVDEYRHLKINPWDFKDAGSLFLKCLSLTFRRAYRFPCIKDRR